VFIPDQKYYELSLQKHASPLPMVCRRMCIHPRPEVLVFRNKHPRCLLYRTFTFSFGRREMGAALLKAY
jgi:hypothetical protein